MDVQCGDLSMNIYFINPLESSKPDYKTSFVAGLMPAGFPSPAQGFVEKRLDVNDLCIPDLPNTFLVTVDGEFMVNTGIHYADMLVVNRALKPRHGDFVVATIYVEQTVKELHTKPIIRLISHNNSFKPI